MDVPGYEADAAGEGTDAGTHTKLRLPASCEPPRLNSPAKQLAWIVSAIKTPSKQGAQPLYADLRRHRAHGQVACQVRLGPR